MPKNGQSGGFKPKSHPEIGLSGKVSALGFEPRTNGLKGQNQLCASYDQEPTNSALSIGRRIKKVSWMLILKFESTIMCPVDFSDSSFILHNPLDLFLVVIQRFYVQRTWCPKEFTHKMHLCTSQEQLYYEKAQKPRLVNRLSLSIFCGYLC
jgi:hypothetical protein